MCLSSVQAVGLAKSKGALRDASVVHGIINSKMLGQNLFGRGELVSVHAHPAHMMVSLA